MSFGTWLLAELRLPKGVKGKAESDHSWWRVMCLTGVDYFSTLGYQPGIAFLAAGALSPIATVILVAVTLFAALPVYHRVAEASPNGQGSIAMLEHLFPQWKGKLLVLILLGFATTDFVITMTLSAADAAAHFALNPFVPGWMTNRMAITLVILAFLGAIFLKGFKEAINVAVYLVGTYLLLNAVATGVALVHVMQQPHLFLDWKHALYSSHGNVAGMIGVSLILFPKLALGLSGFETGVAVMPLIKGANLAERVKNTRKLLNSAAMIMSFFLMVTSIVTTLLIPPEAFKEGGAANGRAMAYLAHQYLGPAFGSIYDISTILILGFAGASAMAGLLNLIPRFLPRLGMAPEWARASRPLVLVFMAIAFTVTYLFHADVDAQGGAYATGVLVLITSAAIAVTIYLRKRLLALPFLLISLIFIYTTILNIIERPEGIKIASFFIVITMISSLISRALRSTELRILGIRLDQKAVEVLGDDSDLVIRLVARKPRTESEQELDVIDRKVREYHSLSPTECLCFFEVEHGDASDFEKNLLVTGERVGKHRILRATSPAIANAFAALLIELEKRTGKVPHAYFKWREGNPITNLIEFLFFGEGDIAPLAHEVLRRAVNNPAHRPVIHVS
ncbi:MAG TPA: amino acid permease [Candidatus Angelobacter sp.]|nr:amino acid permease [Candidatus Angelobacter sp.]